MTVNVKSILANIVSALPVVKEVAAGAAALGIPLVGAAASLIPAISDTLISIKAAAEHRQEMADADDLAEIERLLAEIEAINVEKAKLVDES